MRFSKRHIADIALVAIAIYTIVLVVAALRELGAF